MCCIYLRTNSELCRLQHKLIGFYNRDEKCLQRGTDWVFKWNGLRFSFKALMIRRLYIQLLQWNNKSVISTQVSSGRSVEDCTGDPYERENRLRHFTSPTCDRRLNTSSLISWTSVTISRTTRFKSQKFYVFKTDYIQVFSINLKIRSDYFRVQKLIDFHVFCTVHCNIITQHKPTKCTFFN